MMAIAIIPISFYYHTSTWLQYCITRFGSRDTHTAHNNNAYYTLVQILYITTCMQSIINIITYRVVYPTAAVRNGFDR